MVSELMLEDKSTVNIVFTLLWTHRGAQTGTFEKAKKCKISSYQDIRGVNNNQILFFLEVFASQCKYTPLRAKPSTRNYTLLK